MITDTTGGLKLSVDINISAEDFAKWKPELVAIFMEGIARMLSAQAQTNAAAARE